MFIDEYLHGKLADLADKIEARAVSEIDKRGLVAWGKLRAAVRTRFAGSMADGWLITVAVGDAVPYAQYLHEGIKPHMPPIMPLMAWAKKKLGLKGQINQTRLRYTKKGVKANKQDTDTYFEARRMAWAAAIKIKKEGRKPDPFLLDAVRIELQNFKLYA